MGIYWGKDLQNIRLNLAKKILCIPNTVINEENV